MANSDASQYTLRYNEITGIIEFGSGNNWFSTGISSVEGISQLTGDVTAGPGSGSQAATLATVNPDVGSFTSANITVNAKGLITAAADGAGSPGVFTPTVFTRFVGSVNTTSSTYTNTTIVQPFAMATSTHRVKVTISGDGNVGTAGNQLVTVIAVDGTPAYSGYMGIIGTSADGGQQVEFGTIVMQAVFTPGDTASHVYSAQYASTDNTTNVIYPNSNGFIIIEEII